MLTIKYSSTEQFQPLLKKNLKKKYIHSNLSPNDLELRFGGDKAKFLDLTKCYMDGADCDVNLEWDAYT